MGLWVSNVGLFLRHRRFLGAVVLRAGDAIAHADPEAAVRACSGSVFATSVIRVAYGGGFTTPSPVDDETFSAELGEQAVRYLLS